MRDSFPAARVLAWLMFILPGLAACLPAHAANVYEIREGHSGGNVFSSLEEFRLAVEADTVTLYDGDAIVLYNNDSTLTAMLQLPDNVRIAMRSADGKNFQVQPDPANTDLCVVGNNLLSGTAHLGFENLTFANAATGLSVIGAANSDFTVTGSLEISGCNFYDNDSLGVVYISGDMEALINNCVMQGNSGYGIWAETASYRETQNITLNFDYFAPPTTVWDNGIEFFGDGKQNLTVNVADDKIFNMKGSISGINSSAGLSRLTVNKTGDGVFKVGMDGGSSFVNTTAIQQGTMQFGTGRWTGDSISVEENAVFKITLDPGENFSEWLADSENTAIVGWKASSFSLNSFQSREGARTEVGGISKFPAVPIVTKSGDDDNRVTTTHTFFYTPIHVNNGTINSTMAQSMNIENKLMKATWYASDGRDLSNEESIEEQLKDVPDEDKFYYVLSFEYINNLAALDGLGDYADAYRLLGDLTDPERDMLDSLYARGEGSTYELGQLQTIGGQIVENTMLALHMNQSKLLNKINRRLTSYQKEELSLEPEITGSDVCYYDDCDPLNRYAELWAYIEGNWDRTNDNELLAGYKWNNYTLGLGYEWHRDEIIYGVSAAISNGKMSLQNNSATSSKITDIIAAVYGSWARDGWYLSGSGTAGYGWNSSEGAYSLVGAGSALGKTGTYGTSSLGANLEFGYMMETAFMGIPMRVTPYGSLTYSRTNRNAVRESGAVLYDGDGNVIDYNKQWRSGVWDAFVGAVGLRVAVPVDACSYTAVPYVDVALTRTAGHIHSDNDNAYFLRDPSASWNYSLLHDNRTSLRFTGGVDAKIRDNLTIGASYDFEWRRQYWRNQFGVNMTLGF